MSFTVTIEFDGLFVFVNRPKPPSGQPALHVLLAKTPADPPLGQHKHQHSWTVEVDGKSKKMKGDEDWTGIGLRPGAGATIPHALPLSRTTGVTVSEATLTGPFKSSQLEGRIKLPLPASAAAADSQEKVEVIWESSPGTTESLGDMTGRIVLSYMVDSAVRIPGFKPITSDAKVTVRHLPENPHHAQHRKGDRLGHAHMHAPIFDDVAPVFTIGHDYPGPSKALDEFRGVDPVVCTAGNGCPPENPDCGEG